MYSCQLITTEDGSHSVFVPELNESYHSLNGAIAESKHVYIKNGFRHLLSLTNSDRVNILEIGFGTGLNAYLTLIENRIYKRIISYTSIEPYPLSQDILDKLNYSSIIIDSEKKISLMDFHNGPWNKFFPVSATFNLQKLRCKFQDYNPGVNQFDLIYYDAFAPGKQPEIWDIALLQKSAYCLKKPGILVTYAAKGQLKRDLKAAGLNVETLKGALKKKEMVRGSKL